MAQTQLTVTRTLNGKPISEDELRGMDVYNDVIQRTFNEVIKRVEAVNNIILSETNDSGDTTSMVS